MTDPKSLTTDWTPADLDNPPKGTVWREVARDVFRAAGVYVDVAGDAYRRGGWVLGDQVGVWCPCDGIGRSERSGAAAIRAILAHPDVTVIPAECRQRLMAWLDGDATTAPTPATCTPAPPRCVGSTCVEVSP